MTEQPNIAVTISWRPFLLRPNAPLEGTPKPPDTPDNPRVGARMKAAGAAVGINFTGRCDRAPNTVRAHALLKYFEGKPEQNNLQEILFRQYFTDGLYPDSTNLRAAAEEAGANSLDKVMTYVASNDAQKAVKVEAAEYSRQGVNGVPFFIFNGEPQFSGAQPVQSFKRALLGSMA